MTFDWTINNAGLRREFQTLKTWEPTNNTAAPTIHNVARRRRFPGNGAVVASDALEA